MSVLGALLGYRVKRMLRETGLNVPWARDKEGQALGMPPDARSHAGIEAQRKPMALC